MGADAGQKFLTARGEAWAKSPMLALKSDRQRLGGPFAVEAMTQIPFQKLVRLAYNLHEGASPNFCNHGSRLDLHHFLAATPRDIKIEIFAPHPSQDTESPRCLPALCEL